MPRITKVMIWLFMDCFKMPYSSVGLLLSEAPNSSKKQYIETHKAFHASYASLVLKNWKKGNIFHGIIEQDFTTCAAHKSMYQTLASNLK